MKEDYEVIILSKSGDFLLKKQNYLERKEHGIEAENPFIMTEGETAQRIKAERIFIPYTSIENIQFGDFEQETEE